MARVLVTNEPLQLEHVETDLFHHCPPYAIEVVAGALRAGGHDAYVLDLKYAEDAKTRFLAALEELEPEVIGFSATKMMNAAAVLELIALAREHAPEAALMAGGQTATHMPDYFLGAKGVDAVILHEAEDIVSEVAERLAARRSLAGIRGLARRSNGSVTIQPAVVSDRPIDERIVPLRTEGLRSVMDDGWAAAIETVRGCPKFCRHCPIPGFHMNKVRRRSVESVLDEMEQLRASGVTELVIVDQCFGVMPEHAMSIVEGMKARDLRFHLAVLTRSGVGVEQPELFDALLDVGLEAILLFFDTNADGFLGPKCVRPTPRQERAFVRKLRRRGVFVNGFTFAGTPGGSFLRELRALLRNGRWSDVHSPIMYTPFVGTPAHAELSEAGALTTNDPSDFDYSTYVVADGRNRRALTLLLQTARLFTFVDPWKPFKMLRPGAVARRRLIGRGFKSIPRIARRIKAGDS